MSNNEIYLKKLHEEILSILDEIVRVCEANNLKYYLIGGTLLGAIRHKGFIPWDDDLDIVMPREDFETFIAVAPQVLSDIYELDWISNNKNYWQVFAKVRNKKTVFEEEICQGISQKGGIFVDIFPLDVTSGYGRNVEFRKKIVNTLHNMMYYKCAKTKVKGVKKLVVNVFPMGLLHKMCTGVMKASNGKNGGYYSNFGSQYSIKKQTYRKELFGSGIQLPFEDRFYICPDDSIAILTSIFGVNYMQLPPEEKRRIHYPLSVVFSDGSIQQFEHVTNKVKVE